MIKPDRQVYLSYPFIPVSVNSIWKQGKGRTYKPQAVVVMQRDIEILTRAQIKGGISDYSGKGFKVSIDFFSDKFFTAKGSIALRRHDIDNMPKILLDSIFKFIDCDDSNILELHLTKQAGRDKTTVLIEYSL